MGVDDALWATLLAHMDERVLITVVGPDIPVAGAGDSQQTFTGLIGQSLAETYHLSMPAGEISMGLAVAEFIRKYGRDEVDTLYEVINRIIKKLDPEPGEALRNLAAIGDLRWFVSTTPDHLLAQALNDVRFNGESMTREIYFSPQQSTSEVDRNELAASSDDTVVLSLFGQASTLPTFAIHEADELEWLHALLTQPAGLPHWLQSSLKQDPLLFIGCEIHDWLGRFLLRMESSTRLLDERKQFFFVSSPSCNEASLSNFFSTYCRKNQVQQISMEPTDFIAELRARWDADHKKPDNDDGDPEITSTIFISYMREDIDAARRLADAITRIGGDVWLDERRLRSGDSWEHDILNAIRRRVLLFIPVISANTERAGRGYVFHEWNEAVEMSASMPPGRRFIIPVMVDPSGQADPDNYQRVPDKFREVNFGRAPSGQPDQELLTRLTEEIRAIRGGEPA